MTVPRLRMIGGPNGSGKTTLFDYLRAQSFSLGRCQNPDEVEAQIRRSGRLSFRKMGVAVQQDEIPDFLKRHPLGQAAWPKGVSVSRNVVRIDPAVRGGYLAAVLCDFIRRKWLESHESFSFETVMSGEDKLQLLKDARRIGYRTYLYYICTNSPLISRQRVAVRVVEGGHDVPPQKIDSRYVKSLRLLPRAIALSSRAFLFDNSGASHRLIAEYEDGCLKSASPELPPWYVLSVLHAPPDVS